jgi:hypothetical protein
MYGLCDVMGVTAGAGHHDYKWGRMPFNEIRGAVVDAAMRVHSALGPGLLENVYEACRIHELNKRGFRTAA